MHVVQVELDMSHLCETCQFSHKCLRLKSVIGSRDSIEENVLDKWRMDLDMNVYIKKCDLYTADMEKINNIVEQKVREAIQGEGDER